MLLAKRVAAGPAVPDAPLRLLSLTLQHPSTRTPRAVRSMSYTYIPAGVTTAALDDLARPVAGRLFFAGEATHRAHYGTAHGAYDSGLRAAAALLQQLAAEAAQEVAGRAGQRLPLQPRLRLLPPPPPRHQQRERMAAGKGSSWGKPQTVGVLGPDQWLATSAAATGAVLQESGGGAPATMGVGSSPAAAAATAMVFAVPHNGGVVPAAASGTIGGSGEDSSCGLAGGGANEGQQEQGGSDRKQEDEEEDYGKVGQARVPPRPAARSRM